MGILGRIFGGGSDDREEGDTTEADTTHRCTCCGGALGEDPEAWGLCEECYEDAEPSARYCCGVIYEDGEDTCMSCGEPL